jgi:hypothetical protein
MERFPWWAAVGTVVGLIALADEETRWTGAAFVIAFGAFTVMGVALRRRGPRRVQVVDGGFFLAFSVVRQLVIAGGCVLGSLGSVLLILDGEPRAWISAVGMGVMALYLARVAQRPNGLALNAAGLVAVWRGRTELAWDDMTIVAARDGDLIIRGMDIDPIELPAGYLPLAPHEVIALLETYRDRPERRAAIGTEAELLRLTDAVLR